MAGINHLHSDEPQPNLRHRCSRQQLAKGAAGRRLTVDLGDEVAHAKTGGVASASLDHVGNLVVVGVDRDSKRPALAFERHRQGALLRARGAASLVVGGTPRPLAVGSRVRGRRDQFKRLVKLPAGLLIAWHVDSFVGGEVEVEEAEHRLPMWYGAESSTLYLKV